MKKYFKFSLLSMVPLILQAAENSKPPLRKKIMRKGLASSSDTLNIVDREPAGRELAKSLPINISNSKTKPEESVEIFTFSPCTYFCFASMTEHNSYTPTDIDGSRR